jgi:tripartite-type tricarboxylate transporter receptor subunit TctC
MVMQPSRISHCGLAARAIASISAAAVLVLGPATPARAQDPFPSKTVRIVLPQPAGGAVDLIARTLADKISPALGQPVIVENQPGANGGLAAGNVARSTPDGHTLFFAIDTNMAVNPHLYPSLTYDPFKDFEPISLIVRLDLVLAANPGVPANDLKQLIAYSKANPDKLNYASVGQGSIQHLGMEMIKLRSGLNITHVPYRGTAPATTDLVSGVIQAMLTGPQAAQPQIEAGKLKGLAVAGQTRSKLMPQVPTIREQGIEGVDFSSWFALFAPARTPPPVLKRWTDEVAKATADAGVRSKLEGTGLQVVGSSAAGLTAAMQRDTEKWRAFLKETGITMPK